MAGKGATSPIGTADRERPLRSKMEPAPYVADGRDLVETDKLANIRSRADQDSRSTPRIRSRYRKRPTCEIARPTRLSRLSGGFFGFGWSANVPDGAM